VSTSFGGLSYEHLCGKFFVAGAIAAGSVDWENSRRVMDNLASNGVSEAKANFDGWTLSADVMTTGQLKSFWCMNPRLNLSLRYAGLFLGDYREQGSSSDIRVTDRNISLIKVRGEFALAHFGSRYIAPFCSNLEPYIGVAGRFQVGGQDVDSELIGVALQFDSGAPCNLAEGLLGLRGELNWRCLAVSFNLEGMLDSANSSRVLGEVGLDWRF